MVDPGKQKILSCPAGSVFSRCNRTDFIRLLKSSIQLLSLLIIRIRRTISACTLCFSHSCPCRPIVLHLALSTGFKNAGHPSISEMESLYRKSGLISADKSGAEINPLFLLQIKPETDRILTVYCCSAAGLI